MGVFIKGMEMPKNCVVCKNYYYCELWSKLTVNKRCKERHPDCPIVEVKEPHGNLIDIDQMVNDFWDGNSMMIGEHELEQIKTIVEAEE